MLHERGILLAVSVTIEALHFLIPCIFCDVLVARRDDCPSWRRSLVVNGSTRQEEYLSIYSEMADSHTKQRRKHQNNDRKTVHGTIAGFFFRCRLKIHVSSIYFSPRKFYCLHKSRLYKMSSSYEYSCWTRTDGVTTSLRLSTTTGRERTVPGRAPPHTPLLELQTRR